MAHIQKKIEQWHLAWIEACQDRLFVRDARWVEKTRNLQVGDVVWMVEDSKLKKKLKWGIVKTIHPDHDGVVCDVIVRYVLLKPGPEPYISAYTKGSHFKSKLYSVQSLALMYSVEDQQADREERMKDPLSSSSPVDIIENHTIEQKTNIISVASDKEQETKLKEKTNQQKYQTSYLLN